MRNTDSQVLRLECLRVGFQGRPVIHDFSLEIAAGECLGIVGQSGAGKSLALLAALGLAPKGAEISGTARYRDMDLIGAPRRVLRSIRGRHVAMIFQDPMSSLTPHLRIGTQLEESLKAHGKASWRTARGLAQRLLARVRMSDPALRLTQYPHELSGGMRQRVMIAMALAGEPELLIADEPTTALDVTTQAAILALLLELKRERGLALALITHDFGVVAGLADRIAVAHAGRIIETADAADILTRPKKEYTRALIGSARALESLQSVANTAPEAAIPDRYALSVASLCVSYPGRRRGWVGRARIRALDNVAIEVSAGESFGVLGESGSGKSTLIRAVLQLIRQDEGTVIWMGQRLGELDKAALFGFRSQAQLIFQDPFGSLDPAMTVMQLLAEPLQIHRSLSKQARKEQVLRALAEVALSHDFASRYPEQLSGGQCQRVGIARALVLEPRLLVCDEPISALDVSAQAQVIALFRELQQRRGLTLILVSHHLGMIRALCTRALVLYRGRMMECAPVADLYESPAHPYTRALLAAIPVADADEQPSRLLALASLAGEFEADQSTGCGYRNRCPHAAEVCHCVIPVWESIAPGHRVACHRWRELRKRA